MGCLTAKASGSVASFINPTVTDIESARVYFSPTQLGEGTPSPDNVREIVERTGVELYQCGKNLFDGEVLGARFVNNTVGQPLQTESTGTWRISKNGIKVDGGSKLYCYTKYGKLVDATNRPYIIQTDENDNYIAINTSYLPPLTLNSNTRYIRFQITTSLWNNYGSYFFTTTPPETIPCTFIDDYLSKTTITENKTINSEGALISESKMAVTDFIPVNENEQWDLKFTATTSARTRRIYGYDANQEPVSSLKNASWVTVGEVCTLSATITSDIKYIRVCYYIDDTNKSLTINGADIINVYGGYVDLVKGELVEEFTIVDLATVVTNVQTFSSFKMFFSASLSSLGLDETGSTSDDFVGVCNTYPIIKYGTNQTTDYAMSVRSDSNRKAIYVRTDGTDEVLPIGYAVLKLATPITYQLTPQQLQTFKNENNIWSDGDSVEIDYDLAETFDIQKAKRKIIMSQPHVESASNSPSSPQVIKFKTDMKAPLKQCIVNFAPIQEGSGDPSPTNIRPIKGWNGITLKHTGINMLQCSSPSYYIDATNNGITSQSSRNADNEIIGIDFNGTTTSTNIFRNLNYNPSDSGAVTMPRGLMGLTGYSDQVYIIPMGNGNAPRTTDGRYWTGANTNSENGWNIWSVDSSETYNGLWVRTQIFPRETNVNVDTTVYPMMCLAEDVGCEFEPYKGETFDVDWTDEIGTVYGGYVDLISGELWADHAMFTVDEPNATCTLASPSILRFVFPLKYYFSGPSRKGASMCTILPENASINWDYGYVDNISATTTTDNHQLCLNYVGNGDGWSELVGEEATVENVKAYLRNAGFAICATLRTPILITTLTPQQLITLKGQNNLWADTNGTIDVKYWNHKKSDSTGVIYEAENLSFDGTNYIDTGVYLFSEENINRDFEVVIEDLYGNSGTDSRLTMVLTIVCAKYDSTAVGFLIRLNSATSTTYNGTIFMKPNNHNNITIKRVNGVITIDGEVITNPTVKFTNTVHNHPLVLGCALQDDGTPMRYATGTIGHITVKWL